MTGQQVHNPSDKRGKENHDVYPYSGVWIIDDMTKRLDVSLAHRRNLVLREEGPGSTVRIYMTTIMM